MVLFITSYLPWYFIEHPTKIIKTYFKYARAFFEIISVIFLLKTLLSPWKSIADEYPTNLMNIGEIAQVFTLNMTTRIIGLLFRLVALLFSIVSHICLLAGFLAYLLFWLTYPAILAGGILHAIYTI
ncbi:MAG: hypothetical protein KAS32_00390 [Candidatus Peribacteraceae bacterium]|nr:hypothetical protein [Candidatus Peribacteraceae bacterium]